MQLKFRLSEGEEGGRGQMLGRSAWGTSQDGQLPASPDQPRGLVMLESVRDCFCSHIAKLVATSPAVMDESGESRGRGKWEREEGGGATGARRTEGKKEDISGRADPLHAAHGRTAWLDTPISCRRALRFFFIRTG